MEIKRLAATFGKLEQEQLELSPGLNLIEAPNESGKSTWTAFLRVMLYGLNTRDRSPNADKRRYLPWSGSAMEGVLEAAADLGDITLLRRTARANSPMGAFSAVYTGTAQAVTDLTAASCGETLLGVPQDVFERSAYIRQTGLAVEQSKALEQRITSLVTTGEEDTSFTGAADQLRRQGVHAQCDLMGRSVKAQMKYANKIGAKYVIVLGEDELQKGEALLKSMHSGKTAAIRLDGSFSDTVYEEIMSSAYAELEEAADNLGLDIHGGEPPLSRPT